MSAPWTPPSPRQGPFLLRRWWTVCRFSRRSTVGAATPARGEDAGVDSVGVSRGDQRRRRDARHRLERPRRLARAHPERVVPELLALVVPALKMPGGGRRRPNGGAAAAAALVESMARRRGVCVLLLVPLMGRMSDPVQGTRETATRSFAALVPLPLARGAAPPPDCRIRSANVRRATARFSRRSSITQVRFRARYAPDAATVSAGGSTGRRFSGASSCTARCATTWAWGRRWSTCILAATVVEVARRLPISRAVVCPPTGRTLGARDQQYVDEDVLRPLQYQGTPHERGDSTSDCVGEVRRRHHLAIAALHATAAGGHIVVLLHPRRGARHSQTARITRAVKRVRAEHRLLLGTPIQNDVVELWSLFDFPCRASSAPSASFIDDESPAIRRRKRRRTHRTGRPRHGKTPQAGDAVRERRTKDEVLKDLPEDHPGCLLRLVADRSLQ